MQKKHYIKSSNHKIQGEPLPKISIFPNTWKNLNAGMREEATQLMALRYLSVRFTTPQQLESYQCSTICSDSWNFNKKNSYQAISISS